MKQGIITPHFGRVVGKRVQLRQGDGNDHLSLWLRRGGRGFLHLGRSAPPLGRGRVGAAQNISPPENEKNGHLPMSVFVSCMKFGADIGCKFLG